MKAINTALLYAYELEILLLKENRFVCHVIKTKRKSGDT